MNGQSESDRRTSVTTWPTVDGAVDLDEWTRYWGQEKPLILNIGWTLGADSRWIASSVQIRTHDPSDELTASRINRIPFGAILKNARQSAEWLDGQVPESSQGRSGTWEGRGPGRPPIYGEDHWKEVRSVVEQTTDGRPRKALMDHFGATPNMAKGWLRQIRTKPQLGASDEGDDTA